MKKRFLAAVLCTAIVFVFAPSMALADDTYSGLTVSGGTAGVDYSFNVGTNTLTILSGTPLTLSDTYANTSTYAISNRHTYTFRFTVGPGKRTNVGFGGHNAVIHRRQDDSDSGSKRRHVAV